MVVNVSNNQWAFHDYGVLMGGESGTWTEIFNSQAPDYGGVNTTGNFGEFLGRPIEARRCSWSSASPGVNLRAGNHRFNTIISG